MLLRPTLRPKKQFPQTQVIKSVPAPIGGLNTRDAIASMPPMDAVSLVNWLPDTYGVRARKGYREWAINIPANRPVGGIMGYFSPTTIIPGGAFLTDPTSMPGKLFCSTDAAIYDITSQTNSPVSAIALSGATNAGWFNHTMMTTTGGSFLLACSEADGYFTYDGAAWLRRVAGGGAGQISGVNPNDLVHVAMWKRRAWFTERNSSKAWYLPVDQFAGVAASIDFGPMFKHGGHLSFMANWTIDAGEGIDDFLVAVGSNGDILVYKGTDPASAATFSLVGAWYVGQIPVGRRAAVQYGGDLILVSADGIFPMSYITRGGAALLQASSKEYSSKIRPTIGEDLRASFTERGWQALIHPSERLMLVNVPDYGAVRNKQYAMSTTLNEWTVFNDIPIYTLGSQSGYTFAGSRTGKVYILFTGFFDNVAYGASTGLGIRGVIMPAFNTFDSPALEKQFLMARANFLATDAPNISLGVNVNYDIEDPTGTPVYTNPTSALWDVSIWDAAMWSGGQKVFSEWTSVGAIGWAGAAAMVTSTVGDSVLTSIDYMLASGGPI
jgi:hypothetical protein